jgi:phenylpropionate dioxygenase-like ring-hydroxylating dioxygenase large terminal subunit
MTELSLKQRIEERINRGLLGQWYVVAKSVEVRPGKTFAVKALGKNLVLWRGDDGAVRCLEDFCPHRGAPLSRGEVHGHDIACRYHGVTVDGTGTVTRVPALANCALEGRKAVESFAVREINDGIFAYFPSAEHQEPIPFTPPYEFTDGKHATFLCAAPWECNYRYALDNLVDLMHGPYLHSNSFTLAYGEKRDLVRIDEQNDGFAVARIGQRGENFDWMEAITEVSAPYCRVEIPYPKAAGPGGPMRVVCFITPIDEHNSRIFFWRTRKVSGLERELWRFLFRANLEERHWFVLEQDREMLAAMSDEARNRETLYQHDSGVTRLRRVLFQKAKTQIEYEDAARVAAAK